jgi:hypothetical protein
VRIFAARPAFDPSRVATPSSCTLGTEQMKCHRASTRGGSISLLPVRCSTDRDDRSPLVRQLMWIPEIARLMTSR